MRRFWAGFILAAALGAGCGEHGRTPRRPEPSPPPAAAPEPAEDEGLPEEDAPDEDEGPLDVDHMSRPELEAACFHGSQAACDLLGH